MVQVKDQIRTKVVRDLTVDDILRKIGLSMTGRTCNATLFEVLQNTPCRIFIDYDLPCPELVGEEGIADKLEMIRMSHFRSINQSISDKTQLGYVMLDSTRIKKNVPTVSFHIIFDKVVEDGLACKPFVEILGLHHVDFSVYKKFGKMQLFRLPYCGKDPLDLGFFSILDQKSGKILPFSEVSRELYDKCIISRSATAGEHESTSVAGPGRRPPRGTTFDFIEVSESDKMSSCEWDPVSQAAIEELLFAAISNQNWHWEIWTHMMWCLANISTYWDMDLREAAHKLSMLNGEKYNKLDTEQTYDKALLYSSEKNSNKLRFGTLVRWIRNIDAATWDRWAKKYIPCYLERKLVFSLWCDGDVADYFVDKYYKQYVIFDNRLYKFNGVYWKIVLMHQIHEQLDEVYFHINAYLHDLMQSKKIESDKFNSVLKNLLGLRSMRKKVCFMEAIKIHITVAVSPFDQQIHLLGFPNGVYDLHVDAFRDGLIEDYVSIVCPYDFTEKLDDGQMERAEDFLKSILPRNDEREFLLRILSTCLYGQTLEKFVILTGAGRNGKSVLMDIVMPAVLGPYLYRANNSAITIRSKTDLNVSIANMDRRRAIVYSEPHESETLKNSIIKELTGGGAISFRTLYSSATDVNLAGTHIIQCNKKPLLDKVDSAIAQRLIIVPFRSTFQTLEWIHANVPDGEERVFYHEANEHFKSRNFAEDIRLPMLHILIKAFRIFKNDGFLLKKLPKSIVDLAKDYMIESDTFAAWFAATYEIGDDDDFIQMKSVYNLFKSSDIWSNMTKIDRRAMTYKSLIENFRLNSSMKVFLKERHYMQVDGKQKEFKTTLVKYRLIPDNDSEYDSE